MTYEITNLVRLPRPEAGTDKKRGHIDAVSEPHT